MIADPAPRDYISAGFALVKIPRGRKGPVRPGWNLPENCLKTPADIENLRDCNIGLAHLPSGTCALDIDDYKAATGWLLERGVDLVALFATDDAVQIRSGRPNRGKLLFRLPEPMPTSQVRGDNRIILEFRCADATGTRTVQDVLPPSVHPDTGRPYTLVGDIRNIPRIPAALIDVWRSLIPSKKADSQTANNSSRDLAFSSELKADIESALGSMPSDDYDLWISIGHALKELGADGFKLWDRWSARSEKYRPDEMSARWDGFHPKGTGYKAVFARAQECGWKNPAVANRDLPPITAYETVDARFDEGEKETTRAQRKTGGLPITAGAPEITLEEMIGRFVHITAGNAVGDISRRVVCSLTEFHSRMSSNLLPPVGKQKKGSAVSKAWLTHTDRKTADDIGFMPGADRLFRDDHGLTLFNTFRFPDLGKTREEDLLAPIFDHFEFILGREPDVELFMDWVAFGIQHPARRPVLTPLLVASEHGTGRGWIANLLTKLFGQWNCSTQTLHGMTEDRYQDYLHQTLFCVVNEARETKNRYEINSTLREKLDAQFLQLNLKYGGNKLCQVFTNFLMLSNYPDALIIPKEDRRIFVNQFDGKPASDAYYVELYKHLDNKQMLGQFFWFLKRRDISKFLEIARAPGSAAKQSMISNSISDLEADLLALLSAPPADVMTVRQIKAHIAYFNDALSDRDEKRLDAELCAVLRKRASAYPGSRRRWVPGAEPTRAWVLRNREKWFKSTPDEVRDEIMRAV